MHSALVIATPPLTIEGKQSWPGLQTETIRTIRACEGGVVLSESTWLIPLHSAKGLLTFSSTLDRISQEQGSFQVLFFETEPSFVCSEPR